MSVYFNKKRTWGVIFILQFLLFCGVSHSPYLTSFFVQFFEWKKYIHQFLFSFISISIGDVLYVLTTLSILVLVVFLFYQKRRKKTGLILMITINGFYLIYQCFWGIMYFQPPLTDRMSTEIPDEQEVKALFSEYVKRCNEAREQVKENEQGIYVIGNLDELKKEIIRQQNRLPLPFDEKKTVPIISIKSSLFNKVMDATGILGYYNPFTAEAQYSPNVPASMIPFTIAHETGHQLGYAREYEASFMGFLLAENTSNMDLQYGVSLFVVKSLADYVSSLDPDFYKNKEFLSDKVKRDLEFERKFRRENEGLTRRFFIKSNDVFLKSNRQEGRISYSYFTELFLRYKK